MAYTIRNAHKNDAQQIADIYNHYIENTVITFEEEKVSTSNIEERINKIQHKSFPYIVYEFNNQILGYAYLDNWRSRTAYNITLETSVYIHHHSTQQGIGKVLYAELIKQASDIGTHSLIGVVSSPNTPSRKLHQWFNFELIGNFKEVGIKFGKLIDVEFWQLILK